MNCTALTVVLLVCSHLFQLCTSIPVAVPYQFFFSSTSISRQFVMGGCEVKEWKGMDPLGVAGYPWVTSIECISPGAVFEYRTVLRNGPVQMYLREGFLNANNDSFSYMADSFWAQEGSIINVTLKGAAYVVGGQFIKAKASDSMVAAQITTSYQGPVFRAYHVKEANLVHDIHINEGNLTTGIAKDLMWSSWTNIDPPSITVLNCQRGQSHVADHFHPEGAMYIPFTGRICFQTETNDCIEAGEVRWTSALLRYYETFEPINSTNANAQRMLTAVGADSLCDFPTVFAVNNFDPDKSAGQPNFVDIPKKYMTVRTTTVLTRTLILQGAEL